MLTVTCEKPISLQKSRKLSSCGWLDRANSSVERAIEVSDASNIPSKVSVFYVASPLDELEDVLAEAKRRKAPTLTSRRSLVKKGVAVGVVPNRGSSKLVVNTKAAKEVGMRIDGKLLRIAELF